MTRRERLERKLEKRQEWAQSRRQKASAHFQAAHQATEGIPLGQPILVGHHSERKHRAALDRSDRNMRAGCESSDMAEHHDQAASGIASQLDNSIFSDDADAIEQLEARIEEREEQRERMKEVNAAHKRFLKDPASLDSADLDDAEKHLIRAYVPTYSWTPHPYPPYAFQNLGANIRRDKERIKEVRRRAQRTAAAETAGGVSVEAFGEYCRVTFAEKPEREVLDSLKAAGFRWGAGSWSGRTDALPEGVKV